MQGFGDSYANADTFTVSFSVEMMGLIGAGNNPMVGMTARVTVAVEEASK